MKINMILGIGSDFLNQTRIAEIIHKYGQKFINRIFTEDEKTLAGKYKDPIAFYAKRFAVKEAAAKALGVGIAQGVSWLDFQTINLNSGQPILKISRVAEEILLTKLPENYKYITHVTITDDKPWVQAFVIIEAVK
ncbi:holo-ACP synthase [Bartonella sp. DGB1]|uniref:holo-ACP synthase n=1 Tax=Bartonella sp. DGB1 TaxID=3239807 RepID=UPI003523DBF8